MNLQELNSPLPKPWLNINANSLNANEVDSKVVNATSVISSKLQANLSLSNTFEASTTAATFDPVATNGVQSLYNGVIAVKTVGATCAITMPTAAVLNTVINNPLTTPLDQCSFNLDVYNLSVGVCAISFTSALGVFNWKTGAGGVITFPNTASHIQLKFVRTAVGSFWTVYY